MDTEYEILTPFLQAEQLSSAIHILELSWDKAEAQHDQKACFWCLLSLPYPFSLPTFLWSVLP